MKHLHVACAIIERNGKVLATQRNSTMSMPHKWEFPGGKIKDGERPNECLKREIHEELGIEITIGQSLPLITHQYSSFIITLYPFICKISTGEITLHEHKAIIWLCPDKLYELDWAEADLTLLEDYKQTFIKGAYYSDTIAIFLRTTSAEIIGKLTLGSYSVEQSQTHAWREEIRILHTALASYEGKIYFEYSIPRIGRRIDVVLLVGSVIFVLEFKIGEKEFASYFTDQVYDYALDLKNFHESSHSQYIAPILIATEATAEDAVIAQTPQNDKLLLPIKTNGKNLKSVIDNVLVFAEGDKIDSLQWEKGRYCPTPTIIEAAMALYNNHSVADISRSDAIAINLSNTSDAIAEIIQYSRNKSCKSICFVTGVPGAGKTLVGLNIATTHINKEDNLYSVFLSGNGPLVAILREALARDKVSREKERGRRIKKGEAMSDVKMFIQNVHHFRDDCLRDINPPIEHVALFDEAQRAWNLEQTSSFMRRKKNTPGFNRSEPEFLISCLDRHPDWAVVVCLVGGGQEINTGEAGIGEWIDSLIRSFPDWHMYISSRLTDSEYAAGNELNKLESMKNVVYKDELHLAVSMRSFRAENISLLVKQILDHEISEAKSTHYSVKAKYPIILTRDLSKAKQWLRDRARGTERYGIRCLFPGRAAKTTCN